MFWDEFQRVVFTETREVKIGKAWVEHLDLQKKKETFIYFLNVEHQSVMSSFGKQNKAVLSWEQGL